MSTKSKTTADPIFVECATTAPRLDLKTYLTHSEHNEETWGPRTALIVEEMLTTFMDLSSPKPTIKPTTKAKKVVWALIDRYKASIPTWIHGAAAFSAAIADEQGAELAALMDAEIETLIGNEIDALAAWNIAYGPDVEPADVVELAPVVAEGEAA